MEELKLFLAKLMEMVRHRKEFAQSHQRVDEYILFEDMEKSIGLLLIETIINNEENRNEDNNKER